MTPDRPLGFATVAILDALRRGHRYGLDIVEHTGRPSGTVYPALKRLEDRGFVRGRWEDQELAEREGRPRRKYYALTDQGRGALHEALRRFRELAGPGPEGADPLPEEG